MKKEPIILGVISVLVATGVIGGVLLVTNNNAKPSNQGNSGNTVSNTNTTNQNTPNQPTVQIQSGAYKDGTYTVTEGYRSPGGTDEMDVTLTLKDDKIGSVSIVGRVRSGTSRVYIQDFAEAINGQVVGKGLDEISSLAIVNGASITTEGFKSAVEKIKSKAS